jgi:hypothetical protein
MANLLRALLLLAVALLAKGQDLPPLPPASAPATNSMIYFAASCMDSSGRESALSSEISCLLPRGATALTLAWDASTSSAVTNYRVYRGRASRVYGAHLDAGTNLLLTWPLMNTHTNLIVTICLTNPVGFRLFTNASISSRWE